MKIADSRCHGHKLFLPFEAEPQLTNACQLDARATLQRRRAIRAHRLTVRRRAVDALGTLPDNAGIPALIQLVKTSKDLEVRKQAMNRLQNSHDARAEAFFEELLK